MTDRDSHLAALIREGYTLQEAGDKYGITRERVRQIVARQGVRSAPDPRRRALQRARTLRWLDDTYGEDVERLWKEGVTERDIALELGLPPANIKALVRHRVSAWQRRQRRAKLAANGMPDEALLEAVSEAAAILGCTPSIKGYDRLRREGWVGPSSQTIMRRWYWSEAMALAGLEPNPESPGRGFGEPRYSDEQMGAALRRVRDVVGLPPSIAQYNAHRREEDPVAGTIRRRFRSWVKALEVFDLVR